MLLNILECQHRSENKQIAKTKNTIGRFRDEGRALEIDPAVSGLLLEDVAELADPGLLLLLDGHRCYSSSQHLYYSDASTDLFHYP